MDRLKPPTELQFTGNVSENWRRFKQAYDIYEVAAKIDKEDQKVRAFNFLHVAGPAAHDVYKTFVFEQEGDDAKLDKICQQFESYCNPRKNITYERHVFFTRNMREGEKIDAYVTDLKTKAATCEFSTLQDSLIRDRIICGIRNVHLRERLLREKDLTLEKCVEFCRASEASSMQLKELGETQGSSKSIHGIKNKQISTKKSQKEQKPQHSTQSSQKREPDKPKKRFKCKKMWSFTCTQKLSGIWEIMLKL
ncbi:uncharacterized protein [Argopecten irradians]|uniref:uncharacterized protein n=1 Tax=Argopecten irradians TaxID=31199 RepID=UPI00371E56E8